MQIIDSSSIVKYFSQEPGWEGVRQHLEKSMTLHMALVELASALGKKVSKNMLKKDTAMDALSSYREYADVIDQNAYILEALEIAISKGLSVYDSMFIAVAIKTGSDLVSSDDKQLKIAKELGIRAIRC
jgi:predicted nucleic acid-binding protein